MNLGSQPIQLPYEGNPYTLLNNGAYTVYYGGQYVSASSYVGSVAPGASAVLTQAYWVISPNGPTEIEVPDVPPNISPYSASTPVVTMTSTGPITPVPQIVLLDATNSSFVATLSTAVGFQGRIVLRAINVGANLVTVNTTGGQTIDSNSTATVGPITSGATWQTLELVSDGTNWRSI